MSLSVVRAGIVKYNLTCLFKLVSCLLNLALVCNRCKCNRIVWLEVVVSQSEQIM